jgi:hypothetical protein
MRGRKDVNPSNANHYFASSLAHRTAPSNEATEKTARKKKRKPWGHTPFRGAVFSHPDHKSEVTLHKVQYTTDDKNDQNVAAGRVGHTRYMAGTKSSTLSIKPDPNGVTAAATGKNLQNFLAERTSPRHQAKKGRPRWGQTATRGKLFSDPDRTAEVSLSSMQFQNSSVYDDGGGGGSGGGSSNKNSGANAMAAPGDSVAVEDLAKADAFAASGFAPSPSEVMSRLVVQHNHLQDLTVWSNDAGVFFVRFMGAALSPPAHTHRPAPNKSNIFVVVFVRSPVASLPPSLSLCPPSLSAFSLSLSLSLSLPPHTHDSGPFSSTFLGPLCKVRVSKSPHCRSAVPKHA